MYCLKTNIEIHSPYYKVKAFTVRRAST